MLSIDTMIAIGLIGLILFFIYVFVLHLLKKYVVEAKVIKVEPIIKRQAEQTGYSIGYGANYTYHEHYRYRNVKVGERITFRIKWCSGGVGSVTCKRDGEIFEILYPKIKK